MRYEAPADVSQASQAARRTIEAPTASRSYHFQSAKLVVSKRSDDVGDGVFAARAIAAGELLVVWGGRVVAASEFAFFPEDLRRRSLQVEEDLFLVSEGDVEPADLVNHSCEPNAGLGGATALVAIRGIGRGEEVCYDYATSDCSLFDEFDCRCATTLCRLRVTGRDWMRPELQARYSGRFSPYLQRRIDAR